MQPGCLIDPGIFTVFYRFVTLF